MECGQFRPPACCPEFIPGADLPAVGGDVVAPGGEIGLGAGRGVVPAEFGGAPRATPPGDVRVLGDDGGAP